MRKFLLTALFVGSPLLAFGQAEPFGTVLEKYECKGTSPDGEYQYPLTIEKKGDNYFLNWGNAYHGMGFVQGNRFAVVFISQGTAGVVLYEVRPGQLVGSWAGGDEKVYKETCMADILAKGENNEQQDTNAPERPSAVRRA